MIIRGFEKVSTIEFKKRAQTLSMSPERLYNDVVLPTRASIGSAGYDFRVITKFTLRPGEIKILPTGIKAYMDIDEYLSIHIRSSLAIKYGIVLVNQEGIIDADYYNNSDNEGHIMIAVKNTSDTPYVFEKGDKVAQGIFHKFLLVDSDDVQTERKGGIGSSGK